VAEVVQEAGHEVVIFDQVPAEGFSFIQGSLLDADAVRGAARGTDAICHLGAVGDVYLALERPPLAANVNVVGTVNILEAAMAAGSRKVVYASTWEVYGEPHYLPMDEDHPSNPDHPYSITKFAGEQLVLAYDRLKDVPSLSLRVGTAYGTGMRANSVFSAFVSRAAKREPITISGSGQQGRQFTYARDIGHAFARALESSIRGEKINIVGHEYVTIAELAEAVRRRLPTEVRYAAARVGDVAAARVSNERARQRLGWEPIMTFQQGLDELMDWQLAQRAYDRV